MRLAGVIAVACISVAVAARAQPSSPNPNLDIVQAAMQAHQDGDLARAEAGYRRFLEIEPRNVEVLANLGVVYAAQGRYDDAIAAYRKALAISHLNAPVRMNLGLAYYKAGRCAEALPEFALVIESTPGAFAPTLLSADCHLQLGEVDRTIALLAPIAPAHETDDALNYVLGMAYLQKKQTSEAATYLDRILKKGDSAEARLLMGMAQRAGADYAGARDEFARAVALKPDLPMAHSLHGQALLSTGDRDGAREAFGRELALNPNDFEANLYMGVIHKEEQRYEEAARYFDKAATVRPADPGVRYQQATLYLATGDNSRAQAVLERLVADNAGFTEAHVSLATVYYRLRRCADGDRHKAIAEKLTADAQARQPGAQAPRQDR